MFYQGKQVLVTGGTGFVGRYFVEALLAQGARVRIPLHQRPIPFQDERIEVISADLTQQSDCLRVTEGMDYIVHAAGAVAAAAITTGNPMPAITDNLVLTARMLQAAWTQGVKRMLVFGSSTGYPETDYPVTEAEMFSGPPHPSYFGYGWMRRYLELMGQFVSSKSATEIVIVRPTAIYGPHDNFDPLLSHVIPALIRKAVERMAPFEVWGTGDEVRDFLHVRDLIRGSLLALEKMPACDPVNIGYGQTLTIRQIAETILSAAGYHDAQLVFNADRPTAIPIRRVDTTKAEHMLNFRPEISFEAGIRETVLWYQKESGHVPTL